jgi:hypothetical protein
MPGPIVHLIVQQRLAGALKASPLAPLLTSAPCSPYAAFGSIGPDFLFFSRKEYGTPLDELVNFIFGAYDGLEPMTTFYEDHVQPVEQDVENAVFQLDTTAFQNVFSDLKTTVGLLNTTALTALSAYVTQQVDLFFPLIPKIQHGAPEDQWTWRDFLRYRRTGRFASTLWSLTGSDADLKRYVLGYVSHIATDVVGQPFVNAINGGPRRAHLLRNQLVTNWIDAWSRKHYGDLQGIKSCLKLGSNDHYSAEAVSGSYYHRLVEFEDRRLPDKLQEMLATALNATYSDILHPEMLSGADIDTAYRLWLAWFRRATTFGSAQKPIPVDPPGVAANTLFNDYVSGFPPYPGGGGPPGPVFGNGAILFKLFDFVIWLVDVLAYTMDWTVDNAGAILTLPQQEPLAMAKWLLYQIRKAVYEVYDNLRFILVLGGYLFPEPQDLDRHPWGSALLSPQFAHLTGGPPADFMLYPRSQVVHALLGTPAHHLTYPSTPQELQHAEPAPKPCLDKFPNWFISDEQLPQPLPLSTTEQLLNDSKAPYGGPQATHTVDQNTWQAAQLGSALDFAAHLAANRITALPNYNLDGDRGYGWKTWSSDPIQDDPGVAEPNPEVVLPVYIDA